MTTYDTRARPKAKWSTAYLRFLRSNNESLMLKIAPLAALGILPIDLISNIVPVIGELDDLGFIILLVVITVRTVSRVRSYR